MQDQIEKKEKKDVKYTFPRGKKTKLSAENITVIKKALQNFVTRELENERVETLNMLSQTTDFFLVLYTYKVEKKRDRSGNSNVNVNVNSNKNDKDRDRDKEQIKLFNNQLKKES
jgi:seryl-tRNA(Sec) selenium transferase